MWGHKPTPKEHSAELNSRIVWTAAQVLSDDEDFLLAVAATRKDPGQAQRIAGRYVRSGPGRKAIELILREAAAGDDRTIETRLANLGHAAGTVWSDAPPEPGDARRDRARQRRQRGIELLARRGAQRCLHCGEPGVIGYCSFLEADWDTRTRDAETINTTVRALAESLGFTTYGPTRRRARRSS